MYKAVVRAMVRRAVARLNDGDAEPFLQMATDESEFVFPGDNSWSTMFRPAVADRHAHVTHRGVAEGRAFADRFVAEGIQIEIEDILVNGPPWRCRVGVRAHDFVPSVDRRPRPLRQPLHGGRRAALGQDHPLGDLRGHRAGRRLGSPSAGRTGRLSRSPVR